jgi:hypothetical protein
VWPELGNERLFDIGGLAVQRAVENKGAAVRS